MLFVTDPLQSDGIGDLITMLACGVAMLAPHWRKFEVGAVVAARMTNENKGRIGTGATHERAL
jgi:hypothetical protein